jgi:hypothetical protein
MTVLEFIDKKTTFHDDMIYNQDRNSFNMNICQITEPGVYFILDGKDILKVGKADGRFGLKGRINNYRADNLKRAAWDKTSAKILRIFEDPKMRKKKLKMYVLPVPMVESLFEGYTVKMSRARSVEELLSRQAESEGHSLLLSSQH